MNMRRPTIALLMDHFLTVYQTRIRDAVAFEAKLRNVNLLCLIGRALDSPHEHERVQNAVFNDVTVRDIQGVILTGTTLSSYAGKERVEELCRQFPMPVCNIGLQLTSVPSIAVNNRRFRSIVEHLITVHQCRRIAYIGGPAANEEAAIRREAFLEGLKLCGVPFDPKLERFGKYTLASGYAAATSLIEEGQEFDALVAANDNMAMGAANVLTNRGIRIPDDIRLTGFDDTLAARAYSPPITTMRQPLELMGRYALDSVLDQMAGDTVPLITELDPVLYCRESCGCNPDGDYRVIRPSRSEHSLLETFVARRKKIEEDLDNTIQIPRELFGNWIERLLLTLEQEIKGSSESLFRLFKEILKQGEWRRWLLDELKSVISLLKGYFPSTKAGDIDLEDVWYNLQMLLYDASSKEQMKQRVDADLVSTLFLQRSVDAYNEEPTHDDIIKLVARELEYVGVADAAVQVFPNDAEGVPALTFAVRNGIPIDAEKLGSDAETLFPTFLTSESPKSFVVVPLSAGSDRYGRMLLELGAPDLYYEMLREHLSDYLKNLAGREKIKAAAEVHRRALELLHRQKLESLGLLTGGVARDFNNVLSVIMGNLDVALLELTDETPLHDVVLECKAVAKHAARVCTQLSDYSGLEDAAVNRLNLNQIIGDLEDLLMLSVFKGGRLIIDLSDDLPDIEGDVNRINQILVTLLISISKAMDEGGTIRIHTTHGERVSEWIVPDENGERPPTGEFVIVEVLHTGKRSSKSPIERAGSTVIKGAAPGMDTLIKILRDYRGGLHIESSPDGGMRYEILLPALPRKSTAPRVYQLSAPTAQLTEGGTLLLMDGEPSVLRMGARLLGRLGFNVLLAKHPSQAKSLLEEHEQDVRCVILDAELLRKDDSAELINLLKARPKTKVILSSGGLLPERFEPSLTGPAVFLKKPYDMTALNTAVQQVLGDP